MPIGLLKDTKNQCPRDVRLLGMDLGTKTIGLAVSNTDQTLATPLETVSRTKFSQDIEKLHKIITDYEIGGYILGWPVHMDGSEGPTCDKVRSFADEMLQHSDIFGKNPWIALQDERLSTEAVDYLVDGHVDKKRAKDKGVTDKLAAQIILQGALDFLKN